MLVAMSHGEEGCFFGRDGKPVYTDKIIDLFNNASCKGLRDKPKASLGDIKNFSSNSLPG